MLPKSTSIEFPETLKRERTARGMSRSQLARLAGIHPVMPRRYEEPNCGEFARPVFNTWLALNKALGFNITDVQDFKTNESKEISDIKNYKKSPSLCNASTDEIVTELRKRGISVTLSFSV
jgi:transcriptional regulator with XRE-family HTH domain